MNFNVRL